MELNLTKRQQGIIVLVVALIGLAVLWLVYYFITRPQFYANTNQTNLNSATNSNNQASPGPAKKMSETELATVSVTRLASDFAERFGSYSNQNNFSNLQELKLVATKSWQDYLNTQIKTLAKTSAQIYSGVTTKALSSQVKNITSDSASVLVNTQRQQASANGPDKIYYQAIVVRLLKVGSQWLVDEAKWQ
ncbi:MAG: hypothetical protein WCW02_03780 [Candidatus Buchananbacteria bacterium]